MSNFNPNSKHLSAEEWQAIATDGIHETSQHYMIVGGIVAGLFAASATGFPPTGFLVAGWAFYEAWKKTNTANRNAQAVNDYGCVAHILTGDNLRDFRSQVGSEEAIRQIKWAMDNGYAVSADAEDLVETRPTLPQATAKHAQAPTTDVQSWEPEQFDLLTEMGSRLTNYLIVGIPGSGKGIVVSNAVRSVRQHHPQKTILWIDPKDDPQESGYFAVEGLIARRADTTKMNAVEVALWLRSCIDEFENLKGEKLLVLDELVMVASKLKPRKDDINWLKDYVVGLAAAGDSRGRNGWFVAQNSHLDDLGIGGGIASQLTPLALISDKNIAALGALLRTTFIPKIAKVDETVLRDYMIEPLPRLKRVGFRLQTEIAV
jgi:hypothetical protein